VKVYFSAMTKEDWPEIQSAIKCILMADTKGVVAKDEHGTILAAGVADTFSFTTCQVHQYIRNPLVLRHGFLEEIFNYVFVTCDRIAILGLVPGDNAKALKLNKHLGYHELARVKDGFNVGIDYIIMEMRREECRFINLRKAA